MQMTILAPSTGKVEDVIQRQIGSLAGTLVTTGNNQPIGLDHLVALVGASPSGAIRTEVIDENPDDSVCQLRITTDDEVWLTALQTKLASLDNDPEKMREEVEKMITDVTVEVTPGGQAERVFIQYDPAAAPVAGRFPKMEVTAQAKKSIKKLKASKKNV
jgi:hypothetical protein